MQKREGLGIRGQGTPKMPTSVSTTSTATSRTILPNRIHLPRAGLRQALFAAALAVTAAPSAPGRSTSGPRPRASPRPQRARSRRIPAGETSIAPTPSSVSSSAISAGRAEAKAHRRSSCSPRHNQTRSAGNRGRWSGDSDASNARFSSPSRPSGYSYAVNCRPNTSDNAPRPICVTSPRRVNRTGPAAAGIAI